MSSPSRIANNSNGSITKRALSPVESSSAPKKVQKVQSYEIDSFDEEIAFDQEALIEATMAAEVELKSTKGSSQGTTSPKSSRFIGSSQSTPPSVVSTKSNIPSQSNASLPTSSLTHGDDKVEKETMDAEWYDRLKGEMEKPYFVDLKAFLRKESAAKKTIYPPVHMVHSWSRLTPLSTVKVVILGQDPYHGPKQACGHSFSVQKGVQVPPSLGNIYKELANEYGSSFQRPSHGCLDGWATQGVLLLNACLTVSAGQAGSHHNKGWEPFTQAILKAIVDDASHGQKASIKSSTIANMFSKVDASAPKKTTVSSSGKAINGSGGKSSPSKGVVFLAWGTPAQKSLQNAGITDKTPNVLILRSVHPSPLSAMRGFFGTNHFKKANEWLEADSRYGKGGGIDWGKL